MVFENVQPYVTITRLFDPDPTVSRLRGGDALRLWCSTPHMSGEMFELVEPVDGGIILTPHGLVFGDLALVTTGLFENARIRPLPLILDVHFPFWAPEQITVVSSSVQLKRTEPDGTLVEVPYGERVTEARRFWMDTGNFAQAAELVSRAHVVTTPYKAWAKQLRKFNSEVVVLPDCNNARTAERFLWKFISSAFRKALYRQAGVHWYSTKRTFLNALLNIYGTPYYWLTERRSTIADLEKIKWDYSRD